MNVSFQKILKRSVSSLQTAIATILSHDESKAKESILIASELIDLLLLEFLIDIDGPHWVRALRSASTTLSLLRSEIDERSNNHEKLNSNHTQTSFESTQMIEKKPSTNAFASILSTTTNTTFRSIVSNDAAKQALHENIIFPLTATRSIREKLLCGIRGGIGNCLLYGPPGTGKTLLAQATAREAGANFFPIRPSDILSKYQGESESKIRKIFEHARAKGNSIIFFDEFDSIALSRGGSDDGAQARRLLSELLLQMSLQKQLQSEERASERGEDRVAGPGEHIGRALLQSDGSTEPSEFTPPAACSSIANMTKSGINADFEKEALLEASMSGSRQSTVVVLAATNRLVDLDDAIIRRFESRIYVALPDDNTRILLVKRFLEGVTHNLCCSDLRAIASMTVGWSGADIECLAREAAMGPVRRLISFASSAELSDSQSVGDVTLLDFEAARLKLLQVEE